MKLCGRCMQELEEKFFCKSARARDGLQPWCRPCMVSYNLERSRLPPPVEVVSTASPMEWAWAAGFFDGEGTVGTVRQTNSAPALRLQVSNTHAPTLERLCEIFAAGKVWGPIKTSNPRQKPVYRLEVARKAEVERCLRCLLPFLVTKAVVAAEGLRFLEAGTPESRTGIIEGIVALNRRGVLL